MQFVRTIFRGSSQFFRSIWCEPITSNPVTTLTACLILLVTIGALLVPAVHRGPPSVRHLCELNLKRIGLALLNYEAEHGSFPPPFTVDANGTPLLSWRVLILPQLEEQNLYNRINFDRPWNHPDNLQFTIEMPAVFFCPQWRGSEKIARRTTPYVAICGDETAWPRHGARMLHDIADGTSQTIAVLESEPSRLPWMAPFDPGIESVDGLHVSQDSIVRYAAEKNHSLCLFCDGHTASLGDPFSTETLRAWCTIAGGENQKQK